MLFSELILQGVRNFQGTHRILLSKSFLVFVGDRGSGKSTVVDVISHLLFPNATEPGTDKFNGPAGGPCRAALLLDDEKGGRYRLVQDLSGGGLALTQWDAATSKFNPVSSTVAEIQQYLSSHLRLPQKDIYEDVYVTSDTLLPSARPNQPLAHPRTAASAQRPSPLGRAGHGAAVMGSAGAAAKRRLPPNPHFADAGEQQESPVFPGYRGKAGPDEVLPEDPAEIRSQIDILKRDLALSQEADELQFRLDGLQSELFKINEKLKAEKEIQSRLTQLDADLKQFEKLRALPQDFEKRVREFGRSKERLARDLQRLDEDQQTWEKKSSESAPRSLSHNRLFWAGLGIGVVALIVGVVGFFFHEGLRWVALLDIVGFGIATVVAIRHIDNKAQAERSQSRIGIIEVRRQKVSKQFDLESSIIRKVMVEVGVSDPTEILEQFAQRNKVLQEVDTVRGQLKRTMEDPARIQMEAHQKRLQEEIRDIESKLVGASGLVMAPRDMEVRLQGLEEKLAQLESGNGHDFQAGEYGTGDDSIRGGDLDFRTDLPQGFPFESPAKGGTGEDPAALDPCQVLMKHSVDLFLIERERLENIIADRASQYIAALTNQAYPRMYFGPSGSIECLDVSSGTNLAFSYLPAVIQDLVYLGLKFSILELYSRKNPVPIFLDDPFVRVAPTVYDIIGRMLAGIGRFTQVVLLTGQPNWTQFATSSFRL